MQAFCAGSWSRFAPPKWGLVAPTAYLTLRGQRDLIGDVCKVTLRGTEVLLTPPPVALNVLAICGSCNRFLHFLNLFFLCEEVIFYSMIRGHKLLLKSVKRYCLLIAVLTRQEKIQLVAKLCFVG